jgi:uncharacterized protein YijF (DUF1287 family)
MIRLHKHAALLIAKHEEALSDLLHAANVRPLIGPQLSRTTVWIDHRRVEELRGLLKRAGYTPRLTVEEDGTSERA